MTGNCSSDSQAINVILYSFTSCVKCRNTAEKDKMKEIPGEGEEMGEVGRSVKYAPVLESTLSAQVNKSQLRVYRL